ncbi:hypothetical protein LWI29_007060 [Acer saccharum]|uniref:Cytochrome b5 heme-binding domain-containing protein n=1 Tax=Acer saccharum TaxID=4024 RepID=A0AA39VKK5_ACESA|nr:hypothetical protein LWI29_007060 [Acer saccharum]
MTMAVKNLLKSPFVLFTVFVALIAPLLYKFNPQKRLFSVEELALHNGTDDSIPILLGILGSVFDVTKGKSHYGKGGGYNHFAGRDASRAFVSGNFTGDGLTDSLRGLSSSNVKSVVEWRDFYFRSYKFVGKLVGRYYDNQGNPTKYLKGAEAKAARGAQLMEKQKTEEAKQPSCNSKWSQEEGGEVWCDDGCPRLVQTSETSRNCFDWKDDVVSMVVSMGGGGLVGVIWGPWNWSCFGGSVEGEMGEALVSVGKVDCVGREMWGALVGAGKGLILRVGWVCCICIRKASISVRIWLKRYS